MPDGCECPMRNARQFVAGAIDIERSIEVGDEESLLAQSLDSVLDLLVNATLILCAPCPCCIERDQLRAQVKELAEALRPFADFHGRMVDGPDYSYMDDRIKDWLGVSDFKAASAALAKVEAPRAE